MGLPGFVIFPQKEVQNMAPRNLVVEYCALDFPRFDPQNPRLRSKKQVRQIAQNIVISGFNVPVLVDGRGWLTSSHGRVLIPAERSGRVYYSIELDSCDVETIVRPWQKFTGLETVHQGAGQTFAESDKENADAQ